MVVALIMRIMTKIPIHKIKKVVVNKSDEVASVVEKIIETDASELVLSIPRFSRLSESLANFHLIKRESQFLNKKIVVESVDDRAVELANVAGLEAFNPILARPRRKFTDIVSAKHTKELEMEEGVKTKKLTESVKHSPLKRAAAYKTKRLIIGIGAAAAFFLVALVANATLPKADITIVTVKTPWQYSDSVKGYKLSGIEPVSATVPTQIFSHKNTLQLSFPATGKKFVERRATGKMTVYNAYSSDPQPLVATTRFVAPDGKLFRLAKDAVVPGAKIVEGKIIPSTLEVSVIADQPGADYNIGLVDYFSIPGFKGTPKYQAFYGESKESMTGGFVGEMSFPTDSDIKNAKAEVAQKIESALKDELTKQIPPEFKLIEGASRFVVLKQEVITGSEATANNFQVAAEAELSMMVFKEADMVEMLEKRMRKEAGEDFQFKTFTIGYGVARTDFAAGRLSFPVEFQSAIAKSVNVETLRNGVRGKSEAELKALIYGLPDFQSATISLWPFWVKRVPNNEGRINIVVD